MRRIRPIVRHPDGSYRRRVGWCVEVWRPGTPTDGPPDYIDDLRPPRSKSTRRGRTPPSLREFLMHEDFGVAMDARQRLRENPRLSEREAVRLAVNTQKLVGDDGAKADARVRKLLRTILADEAKVGIREVDTAKSADLDALDPRRHGPWLPNSVPPSAT